ncbi:VPLPA-CTERM-specific exosortase XrtD [Aliiruegeria lutimaris]|uniref:Exosortase D, VPLPA-CTERM-specific n=1 Tax=Aliiruegeria lutimaris TaxID=571298 RepID=A0A1G9FZ80_9RHOB|nr:VPLPA-CTERM-specific exosortase XrtD [Aliiruegeria lutimaris]SDK93690.1 exosortase D, VPLPA-CTERM-specific [Aliiruegeria lutimaris]
MTDENQTALPTRRLADFATPGIVLFACAVLAAGWFFAPGLETLFQAWQTPEYSHGPLIPVISFALFLRHLRDVPVREGPLQGRWQGALVVSLAVLAGLAGRLANIGDIVAYALILWMGGVLLISFGWRQGREFWPAILHLVYMLPLPGVLYYKLSAFLQLISSELGVAILRALGVTVFLEGNIIDFGEMQLHVAEACSGLRYLFPILSFSYVFAILYTGPKWHKAVLLLAAAPITVVMNSIRIAIAGVFVQVWGVAHVQSFTHFFEGWVIFLTSVVLLFGLARLLMLLRRPADGARGEALDLDMSGCLPQLARIRFLWPSPAMALAALLPFTAAIGLAALPERGVQQIDRAPFALFPRSVGGWRAGLPVVLNEDVEQSLAADDYLGIDLFHPESRAAVNFFSAWYADQSAGGVHSPEICLPGAGWEIAALDRIDIAGEIGWPTPFNVNRAVIQKGMVRQLVYYWFDQKGRKVAWDFAAKAWLVVDGVRSGRMDGALVRLTTVILHGESEAEAEARLRDVLGEVVPILPEFLPTSEH